MKKVLWLITVWTLFIPFLMLAHYLAGFKFDIIAVILAIVILFMVNSQVAVVDYHVARFLLLVNTQRTNENYDLYRMHKYWYLFWMFNKLACGIVVIAGLGSQDNINVANIGILSLLTSLFIEVSFNILLELRRNVLFVRGVRILHSEIAGAVTTNPTAQTFLDLAKKFEQARIVQFLYGILFFLIGGGLIILYIVYDSSVPYAIVFFGFTFISWPTIGLISIILLRSNIGKQIMNNNDGVEGGQSSQSKNLSLFPKKLVKSSSNEPASTSRAVVAAEATLSEGNRV